MITGKVYKYVKTELGDFQGEDTTNYLICRVIVGGQTVIQFPIEKTTDTNIVALRVANVVRQTGLVLGNVDVEIDEIP